MLAPRLYIVGGEYAPANGACAADGDAAAVAAELVLKFETTLATAHLTPAERRDAEKTYNKVASHAELPTGGGGASWDWGAYFTALGRGVNLRGYRKHTSLPLFSTLPGSN